MLFRRHGYHAAMTRNRLEAFSDGVIAILITIMVLELTIPHGAELSDLRHTWPVFLSYVISFVYLAIYWNNHHHVLYLTERVTGGVLWANMHLLFWLSLIPFATGWMGENEFAATPTALYGVVLLLAAVAYYILRARDHPQPGQGLAAGAGDRQRPEGQGLRGAVRAGDPGRAGGAVRRPRPSTWWSRPSGWCPTGASSASCWRARTNAGSSRGRGGRVRRGAAAPAL